MNKNSDNLSFLIKEMKYARKLHVDEMKYRLNEQRAIIKDKDFIIKLLGDLKKSESKKITKKRKEKAIEILKKWQDVHYLWIDLVKGNKKWAKDAGGIGWHRRWIKTYQKFLDIID